MPCGFEREALARADGFLNFDKMMEFWRGPPAFQGLNHSLEVSCGAGTDENAVPISYQPVRVRF